jgi:hypothetical protein
MGDIINLRHARKQKQREDRAHEAAGNRAKFGRSKADKVKSDAEQAMDAAKLDGHKREP